LGGRSGAANLRIMVSQEAVAYSTGVMCSLPIRIAIKIEEDKKTNGKASVRTPLIMP